MSRRAYRVLWLMGSAVLLGVLSWLYYRHVWTLPEPTMVWLRGGVVYELLDPRMLAVVLLAPWFVAVLAWTLADLPWQQRVVTVVLRVTFVAALAVALARPVRSADTDKITAVYLVDVSESVSDEALGDAQKLVTEAYQLKRPDDLVRVVTFAERPWLVEPGQTEDGSETAPTVARYQAAPEAPLGPDGKPPRPGARSDLQAALQLAYGLFPPGYLRRAVLISDGLQTDGDLLAEANRAATHGVKLHTVPYKRPVPAEVAEETARVKFVRAADPATAIAR